MAKIPGIGWQMMAIIRNDFFNQENNKMVFIQPS